MSKVKVGIISGVILGIVNIIPMMFMDLPSRNVAMAGAFVNRFAIGFIIPNTMLPLAGLIKGR